VGSCLAGIAQLSRLTSLTLRGYWQGTQQPLQQLLAQPLLLVKLNLQAGDGEGYLPVTNLAALTQLQEFKSSCSLQSRVQFPQLLCRLSLGVCHDSDSLTAAVMPLHHLTYLAVGICFQQHQPLLQPARLPALQELCLHYIDIAEAAATAGAWPQLPRLQDLAIMNYFEPPTRQQMAALLPALAASTGLTRLTFAACINPPQAGEGEQQDEGPTAVCASLAGLTGLQRLYLESDMPAGDAMALTALTNLTYINVQCDTGGVPDFVASALACSLKQLCHLDLSCGMSSMVCLAAIAHLSQLTVLQLLGNSGFTQQGLMLLIIIIMLPNQAIASTPSAPRPSGAEGKREHCSIMFATISLMLLTRLSKLEALTVPRNEEVTDEVVQQFRAAQNSWKQQQQQQQQQHR
jgi:hypothetical protein